MLKFAAITSVKISPTEKAKGIHAKCITVQSEWQQPANEIWNRVKQIATLQYVAYPVFTFLPITPITPQSAWQPNTTVTVKVKLFGLLPLGLHTITLTEIDDQHFQLLTHEYSNIFTLWNHHIAVENLTNNTCRYTDTLTIYAKWLTPLAAWVVKRFFIHRHKRWVKLLNLDN